MGAIENGMVVGAYVDQEAQWAYAEAMEASIEYHLDEMLADDASVEEAISQNADLVRVALNELTASPARGAEIAERLSRMIRSYLEPVAKRAAERGL